MQPAQAMTVIAEIDGRVEIAGVQEGSVIDAGGEIVRLANPAVERDAAVINAQLEWIDLRLRRGGRPPPAGAARPRDGLQLTAKIYELRKQRFEKMKALRTTGDVTARELEHAEIEYLAALRDFNNERRVFGGAPAGTDDLELIRIERAKAAAEQQFAAHRQSLLRITSPFRGTVARMHVSAGQSVFPRDPIADVADLSTLHVRGSMAPELLRYVRPGVRVDVKILGVPVRTFADEIESVIPVDVNEPASRAATVIVIIPNPDGSVQPNTEALITVRPQR